MCSPHRMTMEEPSIQRFSAHSSGSQSPGGTTLVGGDYSPISPVDVSWPASEKVAGTRPLVQTVDGASWIKLDTLPTKLLQELRQGCDVPEQNHKCSHIKGASRVKAWVRQTSHGFVLRFRQKISESRDEVFVAELSPTSAISELPDSTYNPQTRIAHLEPNGVELQNNVKLCELPETGFVEAPNTQVIPELPAALERRRSSSSDQIWNTDPVPGYEAGVTNDSGHFPTPETWEFPTHLPAGNSLPTVSRLQHQLRKQASDSFIEMSAPDSGFDKSHKSIEACEQHNLEASSGLITQPAVKSDESQLQVRQGQNANQILMSLMIIIMQSVNGQEAKPPKAGNLSAGFQVVGRKRYETDTDAEPLRVKTSFSSLRRRRLKKPPVDLTSSEEETDHYSPKDGLQYPDNRRPGLRTAPVSVGREAVLTALLRAQTELLGPQHSLTCRAIRRCPQTPREWTKRRISQLLVIFRKSESLAIQTLGRNHPRIGVFSADIKSFEEFVAHSSWKKSDETTDIPDEQVSSQPASPISPGTRSEADQDHDTAASSTRENPKNVIFKTEISEPSVSTSGSGDLDIAENNMSVPHATSTPLESSSDEITNLLSFPRQPQSPITILTGLVIAAITSFLISILQWLQRNFGPEPALKPGKVRVRWTCSCGERLYDDFTELVPGAGRRLEAFLNRPRAHTSSGHDNVSSSSSGNDSPATPISPNGSTAASSANASPTSPASSHTSWSSAGARASLTTPDQKPCLSSSSSGAATIVPLRYLPSFQPRQDPPYLLTCTSEDRYTTKMTHIDVGPDHITSDMKLALALRAHYENVNRRWWRALRLRGLSSIEFVQFEVHTNRFADIRKCPDVPPRGPGAGSGAAEYAFEADTLPPIGSKLLLHLFRHPMDYDRELMAYLRVPKRTAGRLQVGVGWGIDLVEDFLAERMAVLVGSLVFFASLVFAVAWACERHDVQGAFGVAQWISGGAVFVCGWVQLYVG